jgi:translation initiation factor IF-2
MENFLGKPIKEAHAGNPVRLIGFSSLPQIGGTFTTVATKKEAEALVDDRKRNAPKKSGTGTSAPTQEEIVKDIIPVVIRADAAGTIDAIKHEIRNIKEERLEMRIVSEGVGAVSEGDVKLVAGGKHPGIVLGFNAKIDASARDLADRQGVTIQVFDIIYKLAEWLATEARARAPRHMTEEVTGSAKILKVFSSSRGKIVLGGRVEQGVLEDDREVRLLRRDVELARGHIKSLQSQKVATKSVEAGSEFGALIDMKGAEPAAGDIIECLVMVEK